MKAEIRAAFVATRNGLSPDRVVADPEINQAFLAECRRLGLNATAREINRALLNLRKISGLADLGKSRRSVLANDDEYRFASELAVRFLERRDGVSLDDVICDPILAAEFDVLAARISPGFTPLQYRWAALRLRKTRRLQPEILSHAVPSRQVHILKRVEIELDSIPIDPGLYVFCIPSAALYVGEAQNLRQRVKRHLDHSDRKEFARWIWEFGMDELILELHVLDKAVTTRVRRALEMELIRSRRPLFNVQR